MNSDFLIEKLIEETRQILNKVERLKNHDLPTLIWRENSTSWNVLECLEHLNLYGDFYLSQIQQQIKNASTPSDSEFKSGLLGGYFAKMMLPQVESKKWKTFKSKNPIHTSLNKAVIDKCLNQQLKLLDLLNQSRNISLNRVWIQTTLIAFIKIKLGDTFQFIINHNLRHLSQIDKILAHYSKS